MIPISGFDWVYNILREYLFIGNFYAFREEIVVSLPENILQIIPLVLFYFVIGGIKQMEWKYKANFEGEKVEKAWLIMTVIQIAACGASILAGFVFLVPVALLIYIACIISGIYFLIILNRCKGLCEPVLKE